MPILMVAYVRPRSTMLRQTLVVGRQYTGCSPGPAKVEFFDIESQISRELSKGQ